MYFKKKLYIFCPPCAPKFWVMNEETLNRFLYEEYTFLTYLLQRKNKKKLAIKSSPFH